MRPFLDQLRRLARRVAGRLVPKGAAADVTGGLGFVDAFGKVRQPTQSDLFAELKNTAWTCASINAAVCAANPPRLYVRTGQGDAPPRCRTHALGAAHPLAMSHKHLTRVEEVIDHPLLTLLRNVNEVHNSFDLWELTELYLEVVGSAFWLVERGGVAQVPSRIWVLPAQHVRVHRAPDSPNVVDHYECRSGGAVRRFTPGEIIHFRFPDPRDPYGAGLSPLKACFEQVALLSQYTAMKRAIYENVGIPSVILSAEHLDEDQRRRIEAEWYQKFRRGGHGRALVAESTLHLQVLSHSMGDLAALAEAKATKEDIANAFHIPLPYLSAETNLANMEAAEVFHLRLAITPRLRRRDEKLNEQLIPLYDKSGRLFLATDDPTPANREHVLRQQAQDLRFGVRTINEVRVERGLAPVPWGDVPRSQESGGRSPDATVPTPFSG